jgi:hypothetical protein
MSLAAGAHDRIDRAGRQAFDTSDATIFVDDRDQRRALDAILRVEGKRFAMKQAGESGDCGGAAWRALIDLRKASRDRLGIRATPVVAATRALCLRQKPVDLVSERHRLN